MNSKLKHTTNTSRSKAVTGDQDKPAATIKDLPAAKDPKGGGLLLPAAQKIRG